MGNYNVCRCRYRLLLAVVLLQIFSSSLGADYLAISHKPSYVALDDKVDHIRLTDVQHVVSAMFGFTLHKDLQFSGLHATSPFQLPTCSVVLALYGGDNFLHQLKEPKLHLKVDDVYVSTSSLQHKLEHTYATESNVIEISHESKVSDFDGLLEGMSDSTHTVHRLINELLPSNRLTNATDTQLLQMLRQIALILQSLDRVSADTDNIPGEADFYSYELHLPVSDSDILNEEVNALVEALVEKVKDVMKSLYGEDYVALVLSLPESNVVQSRKTRSLLADPKEPTEEEKAKEAGLAEEWTEDYSAMFHIILWTFVFMAVLTIFVTYGMMSMDPGNDSIIYRMTSTRLKKD